MNHTKWEGKGSPNFLKNEIDAIRPFIEEKIALRRIRESHYISCRDTDNELIKEVTYWGEYAKHNRRWMIRQIFLDNGLIRYSDTPSQTYYIPDINSECM